ncbi:MAG: type II secretion system protein [Capsulimonadales bacterium]|nr:type II secretion system protein [Capsulimonadales bacterium]
MVELLICIAIITLVAAILLPVLLNAREKSHASDCLSNLHQIGLAERIYLNDYDGVYPTNLMLIASFGPHSGLKGCPSAGSKERTSPTLPGYAFNGQLHGVFQAGLMPMHESEIYAPSFTVSVGEVTVPVAINGWGDPLVRGRRHHNGAHFLFCDGHLKWHLPDTVLAVTDVGDGTRPTFNPFFSPNE